MATPGTRMVRVAVPARQLATSGEVGAPLVAGLATRAPSAGQAPATAARRPGTRPSRRVTATVPLRQEEEGLPVRPIGQVGLPCLAILPRPVTAVPTTRPEAAPAVRLGPLLEVTTPRAGAVGAATATVVVQAATGPATEVAVVVAEVTGGAVAPVPSSAAVVPALRLHGAVDATVVATVATILPVRPRVQGAPARPTRRPGSPDVLVVAPVATSDGALVAVLVGAVVPRATGTAVAVVPPALA